MDLVHLATASAAQNPAQYNCTELHQQQCAARRAHPSSTRVLLSSHSLAPSLQQVTSSLCQRLHTCANANHPKISAAPAPGLLPSSTIRPTCNHPSGSGSRPPQPSWPAAGAGWQARQGAQRADATGGGTEQKPTRQQGGGGWRVMARRAGRPAAERRRAQRRRERNQQIVIESKEEKDYTAISTDLCWVSWTNLFISQIHILSL